MYITTSVPNRIMFPVTFASVNSVWHYELNPEEKMSVRKQIKIHSGTHCSCPDWTGPFISKFLEFFFF